MKWWAVILLVAVTGCSPSGKLLPEPKLPRGEVVPPAPEDEWPSYLIVMGRQTGAQPGDANEG